MILSPSLHSHSLHSPTSYTLHSPTFNTLHSPTCHSEGATLLARQATTQPGQQDAQGRPSKVQCSVLNIVQYLMYLEYSIVPGAHY